MARLLVFHFLCGWLAIQSARAQVQEPSQGGVSFSLRQYGWDLGLSYQPAARTTGWQFSGGLVRNPREVLLVNERLPGSKPFRLGKVNHGMWLKPGVVRHFEWGERRSRSDLGIAFVADAHATLAYAWPVYVYMYRPAPLFDVYELKPYEPEIDDSYMIGGMASPRVGLSQGAWIPGLGGSLALRAEWGNYRNTSNSISIGASIDALTRRMPLMQNPTHNRAIFPAIFVNFAFALDV
ncbi:MAG: hypothetical protein ACO3DK_02985 [Bacteroidia bacterium]